MKKLISVLLSLISVICVAFSFVGCGNEKLQEGKFYTVTEAYENGYLTREDVMSIAYYHNGGREHNEEIMDENYSPLPKTPENLSAKTEKSIKQTYFDAYLTRISEATLSDIWIDKYYGTYSGCVAVMMESNFIGYAQALWTETVDGINICYRDGNRIHIWISSDAEGKQQLKEGKFYTVTEAYESGYLTREDVMSIAYYHNGGREHNEEIMDENYVPLPKTPENLSATTEKAIKQTYFDAYLTRISEATLSDIWIDKYYGSYSGCVAVMMESNPIGYAQVLWTEEVNGIKICYNHGNEIKIWRNSKSQ